MADMVLALTVHLADQVRNHGMDEAEAWFHMVTDCLEDSGRELEALQWCRMLAQAANPDLVITVTTHEAV